MKRVLLGAGVLLAVTAWGAPRVVACWGDSVTEGMAMPRDKTFPARLAARLGAGYRVLNAGDGGEDTVTIAARQGAYPLTLARDVVFPAGADAVTLGDASDNGFRTPDGRKLKLTQALGREIPVNPVRIGGASYTLAFRNFRWNSPTNRISYTLLLKRAGKGAEEGLAAGSPVAFASTAVAPDAYCEIFFMGANGGWDRTIETLVAQHRALVARRGADKPYLIIVPYWGGFTEAQKKALEAAFGRHCVRFTPCAEYGYRNNPHDVHLSAAGYDHLAALLHARGSELGYW